MSHKKVPYYFTSFYIFAHKLLCFITDLYFYIEFYVYLNYSKFTLKHSKELSTCRPSTCECVHICNQSESNQGRFLKTSDILQQNRPTDGSVTTYVQCHLHQVKLVRIIQNSSSHKQSKFNKNQQIQSTNLQQK